MANEGQARCLAACVPVSDGGSAVAENLSDTDLVEDDAGRPEGGEPLTGVGVARYVVVSIIGIGKAVGGYGSAKLAHEQAVLAGPVPVRILRVAQFHELVGVLMDMGRQGDVIYLPQMRTQIIAARASPAAPGGSTGRAGFPESAA